MKKNVAVSAVLTVLMLLCLLPIGALCETVAEGSAGAPVVAGAPLTETLYFDAASGIMYSSYDPLGAGFTGEVTALPAGMTCTPGNIALSGCTIESSAEKVLHLVGATVLQLTGVNSITGTYSGAAFASGIYSERGGLAIRGGGSLEITTVSHAVSAGADEIILESGSLTLTASGNISAGVSCLDISISGGSLTATALGSHGTGVVCTDFTLGAGSVTAQAAGTYGTGIASAGTLQLDGGSIVIEGSSVAVKNGIVGKNEVTLGYPNGYRYKTSDTLTAPASYTSGTDTAYAPADTFKYLEFVSISAPAPVLSPAGGTSTSAQSVTMTSSVAGSTIRYTTDGSEPTEQSALYEGPITISQTTTVKAKVFATGYAPSETVSVTYTIDAPPAPPAPEPAPTDDNPDTGEVVSPALLAGLFIAAAAAFAATAMRCRRKEKN